MATDQKTEATTRERLLAAACELFGEKGYHEATIAEICGHAGANIAAVNYHFNSKEDLYVGAWRHSFEQSIRSHPPDGGVGPDAPAEEQFRGRIRALLRRIFDPSCYEFALVSHEIANPTGLLTDAVEEAIAPLRRAMFALIREVIGPDADDRNVHLCQLSVMSQCLHLSHRKWHQRMGRERGPLPPLPGPADMDVDELVEHVVRFSLGGIHAAGRRADTVPGRTAGGAE
ncbi:MAG TPA: CerR family C-terminal domain-containing protein [Phycisphaerae bacterium]|nr:CerR family C-terminal domain-containing protein [Phycisphaerae bacterium]